MIIALNSFSRNPNSSQESDTIFQDIDIGMGDYNLVDYGPVVGENNYVIFSITRKETEMVLDLVSSLNVFDDSTFIIITFLTFIFYILLKIFLKIEPFTFISHLFTQRGFYNKHFVTFIFYVMSLMIIIHAAFSTDLVVKIPAEKVESLKDIVKLALKPIFLKEFETYKSFKDSDDPVKQQVWKNVITTGENKSLIAFAEMQKEIHRLASEVVKGTSVVLVNKYVNRFLLKVGCIFAVTDKHDCNQFRNDDQYFLMSPAFSKSLTTFIFNKYMNKKMKDRLYFM